MPRIGQWHEVPMHGHPLAELGRVHVGAYLFHATTKTCGQLEQKQPGWPQIQFFCELLHVGVPERGAPRASTAPPRNAKHDPAWAPRAANALADARGAAPEDVARTLAELRATQDAVAKSLLDTEDAVLWLQKLEWLELQARFPYTGPHTTAFAR